MGCCRRLDMLFLGDELNASLAGMPFVANQTRRLG